MTPAPHDVSGRSTRAPFGSGAVIRRYAQPLVQLASGTRRNIFRIARSSASAVSASSRASVSARKAGSSASVRLEYAPVRGSHLSASTGASGRCDQEKFVPGCHQAIAADSNRGARARSSTPAR